MSMMIFDNNYIGSIFLSGLMLLIPYLTQGIHMLIKHSHLLFSFLLVFCSSQAIADSDGPLSEFDTVGQWRLAEAVSLAGNNKKTFSVTDGAERVIYNGSEESEISTKSGFGDTWVKMEFMLTEDTEAAIYLQSRYGISIKNSISKKNLEAEDLGGLLHRIVNGEKVDGVAPEKNAAKKAGEWQQLEIKFRAPRYDLANNKINNAFFLDVNVNGESVQQNTIAKGFVVGSKYPWEERYGPVMLRVTKGAIAVRNVDIRHTDFEAVIVPTEYRQKTNLDELIDFVALGKENFGALGCNSCHAIAQNDTSVKSGPNLFGLFGAAPRDREVAEGAEGHRFTVKTDRTYLHNSVRAPTTQLAVIEQGAKKGEAYLPIMPAYSEQVVSDKQIDAIGTYLNTLNTRFKQGPVVKLVTTEGPQQYDPLEDSLQFLVSDRVRTQRGPMVGLSGRSIHVGQPNSIHYSFDPRILGIGKVWQGGFLDVTGEWANRGGGGLKIGFDSRVIDLGEDPYLFAPLNAHGKLIDFSFKEAVYNDFDTISESLNSNIDHFDRIKAIDAQFLGYELDSKNKTQGPKFNYRVGKNKLAVRHDIDANGMVTIKIFGELAIAQQFAVNRQVLRDSKVSAGKLQNGVWYLPAGTKGAQLEGKLNVAAKAWKPEVSTFDHTRQPLNKIPAKANLLQGYSVESYMPPKDNYARPQLFEALGMAVAEDGTIVVATRTAGIWRIVKGEWRLFAEGIFDSLGVVIEDKEGLSVVAGQKAELTRITDTNGDGLADRFETMYDAHSYHGNYHTYLHGPARGGDGAYYFGLNLAHADKGIYKAGGQYMGAVGGFSGWAIRVTPTGEAKLWANGLRSPAGIATAPDGTVWYADNQGEFVATSKLFVLRENRFYGHPSGLVDLPGMTPDSPEIAWERWSDKREKAVVLFPHNIVANSPGHPAWDTSNGRFGMFAGQMFIGDQTQSNLLRVVTEKVNGIEQGVVIPFADGLESGVMRPLFLPDGSLLVGQTGRGWQAKGGHVASLQRLIWDGKTKTQDIYRVAATADGFAVEFTQPLAASLNPATLRDTVVMRSWVYRDAPDYGSETMGERQEAIKDMAISSDRRTLSLTLADTQQPIVHPQQTARVYHIQLKDLRTSSVQEQSSLNAFYTLYEFPAKQ